MDRGKVNRRAIYKASTGSEHIVLTGFLNPLDLQSFFEELYHPDHGNRDIKAVILEEKDMSQEMGGLLSLFNQNASIKFLQGISIIRFFYA